MQQILEFPLVPRFAFDNFVVCPGNATALRFARQLLDPAEAETVLYLHGPSGSGKTHLLNSVAGEAGTSVIPLKEWLSGSVSKQTVSNCLTAPLLLVDDMHLLTAGSTVHDDLWHLFNEFLSAGKRVVATGLHAPKDLAVDEHLRSRLLWGLVAGLDVIDDEARKSIVRKLASDWQMLVPDDAIGYLVTHADRDVGAMIRLVEQIYRTSLALKRPVTTLLIREVYLNGKSGKGQLS